MPTTQHLVYFTNALDSADEALLPSVFRALEMDLGVDAKQLAVLVFLSTVTKACGNLYWGYMADQPTTSRKSLLVKGVAAWGFLTFFLAICSSFQSVVLLRAINGFFLAMMMPISQSVLADIIPGHAIGRAFGRLSFWGGVGASVGSCAAASLGTHWVAGQVRGWRLLFVVVSIVCGAAAWVLHRSMVDPPRGTSSETGPQRTETASTETEGGGLCLKLGTIMSNRSFAILVTQGAFGCLPWVALGGFSTLFLQYSGVPDAVLPIIIVAMRMGSALGMEWAGRLGDRAAEWSKDHGRVLVAQASVLLGMPTIYIVLRLVPKEESSTAYFTVSLFIFSFVSSWSQPATNRPILSDIVDPRTRALVMGTQIALETGISSLAAPLVAYLAQDVYGYEPSALAVSDMSTHERLKNANALGDALIQVMMPPWVLCFLSYGLLHLTYPSDRDRHRSAREVTKG